MEAHQIKVIGRLEKVNFPNLKLFKVKAKIDTGAYTSSIHCSHIEKKERQGVPYVYFKVLDPDHPKYRDKIYKMPIFNEKSVKSSSGSSEQRFFIQTVIQLFDQTFDILLSLTNRGEMKYPILIGRRALKGRFMVDPSQTRLSSKKNPQKNTTKKLKMNPEETPKLQKGVTMPKKKAKQSR